MSGHAFPTPTCQLQIEKGQNVDVIILQKNNCSVANYERLNDLLICQTIKSICDYNLLYSMYCYAVECNGS